MPRNGFRKTILTVAITTACSGAVNHSLALPITITDYFENTGNASGVAGDTAIFVLQRYKGGFAGFGEKCVSSKKSCIFSNTGQISLGSASSIFEVDSKSYFTIKNDGVIDASGGTAILAGSDAGTRLNIINSGIFKADTIVDYQLVGGRLVVTLTGGMLTGDITVASDDSRDALLLKGGGYNGTFTNVDTVGAIVGASSVQGTLSFNSASTSKFEIKPDAELYTRGLSVSNAALTIKEDGRLSLGVNDSNTGSGSAVVTFTNTTSSDISSGTVVVVPEQGFITSITGPKTVKLIQGVSGTDAASAVAVSPLYIIDSKSVSSNLLEATIRANGASPEDVIRSNGGSGNAANAYKLATQSSNATLYRAVASKVGLANTVEFAEELAPTTNGGAIALAQDAQDLSHQNIVKRLNTISPGSGLNAGSLLDGKTLWVQGLYGEGKQDDRKRSDGTTLRGYTSRITGFTMGMDMELGHDLMTGAAVSIGRGSVNKNQVKDNTEMETYMATLYGRWYVDPESDTNLDVFLSYGLHKNRRERFFDVKNTILDEATSDFDSRQYGIKAILSQTMMFDEWAVIPLVGFHYGRFDIDGYKEKGSSAALEMGKQRYEIIEAGLGVGISRAFQYNETEIVPEVKVSGWHDFSGEGVEVQSRFVSGGDTFVAKGIDPEKTTWTASAGVTFVEDEQFEMTTGYERNWRKGFHSDNVYLRAEYKF